MNINKELAYKTKRSKSGRGEDFGFLVAAVEVFAGLGKKPQRNKSQEKRERLQAKLEEEALAEIEEEATKIRRM